AEDGIRDKLVTGVQTCALPISRVSVTRCSRKRRLVSCGPARRGSVSGRSIGERPSTIQSARTEPAPGPDRKPTELNPAAMKQLRSEERRVGKGGRACGVEETGR